MANLEIGTKNGGKNNIKKAKDPIFIEIAGENGQNQEKFFMRSGNSSPELKPSEIQEYIKARYL